MRTAKHTFIAILFERLGITVSELIRTGKACPSRPYSGKPSEPYTANRGHRQMTNYLLPSAVAVKPLVSIAAAVLLLSSCELYRNSPQWEALLGPSPTRIAATAPGRTPGTIQPGDSKTYVAAQWGNPCNISTSNSDYLYYEIWDYCNGLHMFVPTSSVVFVEGVVDTIYQFQY